MAWWIFKRVFLCTQLLEVASDICFIGMRLRSQSAWQRFNQRTIIKVIEMRREIKMRPRMAKKQYNFFTSHAPIDRVELKP